MARALATEARADVRTLLNYVGGAWVGASVRDSLEDRDPATGELTAMVPLSGANDIDAAVIAARSAQPEWRAVSPQQRARALLVLQARLVKNRDRIAALVTADMGKTVADAEGEVTRGIESVEAAAGAPHLLKGENLEGVATGLDVEMVRQPVGVVGAITPFNFPAMIPLWFLPFAIAAGNTFVLKPSERDPRPSELIFEIIDEIDEIPDGVVNLVHGAHDAVNALLDHPGVDAISFVGQASTARFVAERCARNGKRCQALGGAKNALVVMPDADLDKAVPQILHSAFGAAGQRCLAGSVCTVVGDGARRNEVVGAIRSAAVALKLGSGADKDTDVCPMISPEARDRVESAIERAVAGDDQLVLDGRVGGGDAGTSLGPTLIATTDWESEVAREELFGPLLTLVHVNDLDEAMAFANGSRYGNATSIFTQSGDAARAYRYGIEAGMVGVNVGVPAPVAWFPFAGWKDSSDADLHANGPDAIEFYTRKKVVTTRWT
jgi:malonate-semialdehyde dehydrogenase (acetylating) / methylmalonate-semialdehyde dehydrogenase